MVIFHGDNAVSSRSALNQQIDQLKLAQSAEIIRLDGKSVKLEELKQALESGSLFGQMACVVIEGFLTRPKSKDKSAIEEYLAAENPKSVLMWEAKKLSPSQLGKLKIAQISEFKNNPIIFTFLETLGQNQAKSIRLLKELLRSEQPGSVFFMVARHIRTLLQLEDPSVKIAPWQKSKIAAQSKILPKPKLLQLHAWLLAIDERQKTGQSAFDLAGELELLVVQMYHE